MTAVVNRRNRKSKPLAYGDVEDRMALGGEGESEERSKYKIRELERFQYKSRKIIWAPFWRSILIALNIHMDYIIEVIDRERFNYGDNRFSIFDNPDISELEWSVLLLEDRRFLIHSGLDILRGFGRQLKRAIKFQRFGGMSTIEQQLVRTILDDRRRNIARKSRELILANALSYRKTKFDVLRTYLSVAYLGYKIKGADRAANLLFGKDASSLSSTEADFISSLLVYPLPRALSDAAVVADPFKIRDIGSYISDAADIEPRWASRINQRMLYASLLRRNSVKPLYEIH